MPFATHAAFLALFAVIYRVVLNARLALARHAEQEAVKARIREVEERARTYRLASAGSAEPAPDTGSQWMMAAVKQVEGAVGSVLEIGELALRTHSCAAFLLAPDDRTLVLHDCRSSSERVQRGAVLAGEGILAGVLKRSVPGADGLALRPARRDLVRRRAGPPERVRRPARRARWPAPRGAPRRPHGARAVR